MRPLYAILKILLPYIYNILFRKKEMVNVPKKYKNQTIYVSNHPSAFLDPLLVASVGKPIVTFMTRSDVFTWWMKPITWACNMIPIYRAEQDGSGTYDKNQEVFSAAQNVLKKRGNLIMFAEGYTDDVFIRSLKPIKKGPARIAFGTMEATDWSIDLKVQAVGINYANPGMMRSDVVIKWGEPIRMQDLKEMYDENPNKATLHLTKAISKGIQENIIYVEDKSKADFVDHLFILTRKGMHYKHSDRSIPLIQRNEYARSLANRVNNEFTDEAADWEDLKNSTEAYFNELNKRNLDEEFVFNYSASGNKKKSLKNWLFLLLTLPLFLFGCIHHAFPYIITKKMVEKMFKRQVFWSGVKVVLGGIIWMFYTLPVFWLFNSYVYPEIGIDNYWIGFTISLIYYLVVPYFSFLFWYRWINVFKETMAYGKADENALKEMSVNRAELIQKITKMNI
ncbi:MAG: 1-acyl-sn-glycerol-3-phosphate acyltransferase [Crocinitomicaceae bacterium]|nr:1-acyl-sn-glycerol-3-phosphate acyltransferase [Crocinitomicaceae bacterium]